VLQVTRTPNSTTPNSQVAPGFAPTSLLPLAWAAVYVTAFGVALLAVSWPVIDAVARMERASTLSWRETVVNAFGQGVEYRPLFTLMIKLSYEAVGTWLEFYQAVVLLQFAAVLLLVVWLCRPVGRRRAMAACLALSCLCGLHTTRILFGFWPLNQHSAVLVLVLAAIALAFRSESRTIDWVLGLVTLGALFGLELGLLILPVIAVLWLVSAPGLSRRGVGGVVLATALYLATRFAFSSEPAVPTFQNGVGFGFSSMDADGVRATFGDPPWLMWMYNILSTCLTVALSEPRDGTFSFVESLLARDMESWQWFHVGLSALTTLVIVSGLAWGGRRLSGRDRLLVATGLALMLFGSALGFLYTRDRIGLSVGVGYVLLLYVAAAALMDRMPMTGWRQMVVAGGLVVVAAAWVVRSGETFFQIRDTAWDYHQEWTARSAELGVETWASAEPMATMRADALGSTPADPRLDPAWTFALFERRFARSPEAR